MKRQRVAVAVSGGRDSTALWHATARLAARHGTLEVVALHVHHGLVAQADDWVAHLRGQARRWAAAGLPVTLHWRRLDGNPSPGESTEAWARKGRYAALTEMSHSLGIGLVLLAHHRRDQAETFVLQALRGAGPAGLSAMPREVRRGGVIWARPWLDRPREAIDAYLRRYRLGWVEDPSNRDTRWSRNRLREQVWPVLCESFGHAELSLAASAERAQEAAACLRDLAVLDLQSAQNDDGTLSVRAWVALPAARRANLLRTWLSDRSKERVPETLVRRLLEELPRAAVGRWPLGTGELRLHAGRLRPGGAAELPVPTPRQDIRRDLSHAGRFEIPEWRGAFEVRSVARGGLAPERLRACELRPRCGGERFQRGPRTIPRCLKKHFQAAGVPPWSRDGPLVFAAGELLYVPALGIDARQQAAEGSPMLDLRWVPDGGSG